MLRRLDRYPGTVAHSGAKPNLPLPSAPEEVPVVPETPDDTADTEVDLPNHPGKRFIRHKVNRDDSLMGLAARAGCDVEDIRRFNRAVVFDHLDHLHGEYIYIPQNINWRDAVQAPRDLDAEREATARDFVEASGQRASLAEAKFYLGEANGKLREALSAWKADVEWEKANPPGKDGGAGSPASSRRGPVRTVGPGGVDYVRLGSIVQKPAFG